MSSLVSLTKQSTLDAETATMFLQMGIFSRNHPFFREFFQTLKNLKDASDVILFVSQLTISIREKIIELFGQTGIQIPEEQLRLFMETPIELFESFGMSSMTTPPPPPQRGQTILQRLLLLAVIGIVASVIFNYLR